MASKKYTLLIGLLCLLGSGSFSQTITSYDMRDSSLIPAKRLPQHNEFQQNAYPFPAQPRSQWELGVKAGLFDVIGDVRSRIFTPGVGIHVRKPFGYVFSMRAEYTMGWAKGLNFSPSTGYARNPAWAGWPAFGPAYNPTTEPVFYNYKTQISELSVQGVFTLNNIRFHRAKTGVNFYGFAGVGGMIYNTKINAFNDGSGSYQKYNFASALAIPPIYENRKDIRNELKDNILDDTYETHPEEDNGSGKVFNEPFRFVFVVGAGVQFKVSNKWNIAIEDKFSSPKTDLIDGQQWQNNSATQPAMTRDMDSYNFFSVGANFNLGKKAVEPLWWINPLEYAYSEINQPKHMKLPKPILDDTDNDGVTDQFDQEPNTPAGAPVDTHGVSRDTDGDGVPDFRDKELNTPTMCQPVDADGVGKCPDPPCCQELRNRMDSLGTRSPGCGIGDLPSITFKPNSATLSNDGRALLASVAQKMRGNPNCVVAVVGYGISNKTAQQRSWDRVNAIINYLTEKEGINNNRFIFRYGEEGGDENTVDLRDATGEEGPNTVPAPHPGLRRRG